MVAERSRIWEDGLSEQERPALGQCAREAGADASTTPYDNQQGLSTAPAPACPPPAQEAPLFPLFAHLAGARVVVVGAGQVAARKVATLM